MRGGQPKRWLQVTAEVDSVRVGGRSLGVPFHGYVAVVARGGRSAVITAVGRDGSPLETLDFGRGASALYAEQSRRLRGGPYP